MKTKGVKVTQPSIKTVMRNPISDIEHWIKRKDQILKTNVLCFKTMD